MTYPKRHEPSLDIWQTNRFDALVIFLASYTFGWVKMSDFVPNNCHLREVLILFFHLKKTAAEAHRELKKVYGDAALSETTYRDWFCRFKDGDFDVDDRRREERPKTFKDANVIYYELLKPNETITGERYRTQLIHLSRALREKRPQYEQRHEKVILQHDNARTHVAKPVKTYLETLKWEVLPHPLYSLDIFRPIITCSGRWHMVWLISSSAHMKTSKNGLFRG